MSGAARGSKTGPEPIVRTWPSWVYPRRIARLHGSQSKSKSYIDFEHLKFTVRAGAVL